jgi:hypothetical protein
MIRLIKLSLAVGLTVSAVWSAAGTATYKNKIIVSKEDVLKRIKDMGLNDKSLDQTFLPVLVTMAEDAVIKLKVENANLEACDDFKKAANANAEEFKRAYFLQQEAKKKITDTVRKQVHADIKKSVENKKEFKPSVIVCKDEATAKTVIDKIKKGASFSETAKKYSLDPATRPDGGLSPEFIPEGAYSPEISSVLLTLKEGEVSAPIRTNANGGFVYLVLKIESGNRRPQSVPEMNSPAMLNQIDQILISNLVQKVLFDISKDMEIYDLNDQKLPRGNDNSKR